MPGVGPGSDNPAVTTSTSASPAPGVFEEDQNQGNRIGVQLSNLTSTAVQTLGLQTTRTEGVVIQGVYPNAGAEMAGLRKGDIVLSADGVPTTQWPQLVAKIRMTPVGQTFNITYERDGTVQWVPVTVVPWCTATQVQCGVAR